MTWHPTGSRELSLDHVIIGIGLLSAVHFRIAVWVTLTVVSSGRCSNDGADMDLPGSPLTPFTPCRPLGPAGPGLPGNPRSPLIPVGPCGPFGSCLPGGPSGPGCPGRPGFPRIPGLPRLPMLPFGPERQRVSSVAQIWFCRTRSSSLMSNLTYEAFWCSSEARLCLECEPS